MPRKGPAKKGVCQICGEICTVTETGLIRSHGFKKSKTSLRYKEKYVEKIYCLGSGQLSYTESRDFLRKHIIKLQYEIDKINIEIHNIRYDASDINFMWREYVPKSPHIDHYISINVTNFDVLHETIPQAFTHLVKETFEEIKRIAIEGKLRKLHDLEKQHTKQVSRL
jgi:hypothetical protein